MKVQVARDAWYQDSVRYKNMVQQLRLVQKTLIVNGQALADCPEDAPRSLRSLRKAVLEAQEEAEHAVLAVEVVERTCDGETVHLARAQEVLGNLMAPGGHGRRAWRQRSQPKQVLYAFDLWQAQEGLTTRAPRPARDECGQPTKLCRPAASRSCPTSRPA
jgi:hypothetical protein